jgi:uncharacterized protein YkwD/putative cell wall-binding protein
MLFLCAERSMAGHYSDLMIIFVFFCEKAVDKRLVLVYNVLSEQIIAGYCERTVLSMFKKLFCVVMAVCLAALSVPASLSAAEPDIQAENRLAGNDRVGTALAIAAEGWASADAVVLAASDDIMGALLAAPLAGVHDAPVLLTPRNSLAPEVKARIAALGANLVLVVSELAPGVLSELQQMGVAQAIMYGADVHETSERISGNLGQEPFEAPGSGVNGTFIVSPFGAPDALSVSSYAAAHNFKILLTDERGVVADRSKILGQAYIIGGTGVVKDIEGITRFGGANRYATNAAVAAGLDFDFSRVYVANGQTMVDALSAAPLAAKYNAPVLLTDGMSAPVALNDAGVKAGLQGAAVTALGGSAVVPGSLSLNGAVFAASPASPAPAPAPAPAAVSAPAATPVSGGGWINGGTSESDLYRFAREVFDETNELRAKNGLEPFKWSDGIAGLAMIRAEECLEVYQHRRPDGRSITTLAEDAGIGSSGLHGENIAKLIASPQMAVGAWASSGGHLRSMLSDNEYMGVGVAPEDFDMVIGDGSYHVSGTFRVVQWFYTPVEGFGSDVSWEDWKSGNYTLFTDEETREYIEDHAKAYLESIGRNYVTGY